MNQTIDEVAENWYARLNKLKEYHNREGLTIGQKLKSIYLINVLADRLMKMVPLYIQASQPKLKEGVIHPAGVAIIGEAGRELFLPNQKIESIMNRTKRILNYYTDFK